MGSLSDTAGRRPAYIICFGIYIGANIGLALQRSYVGLLLLRALQSSGSSGTVALSNAVVADLVTSSERGIYLVLASLGTILGPSLGPILGGLLSQNLGWQSIFWFLTIFAVIFFVPLLLFYPETCRNVVGDGSIPPPAWNKSYLSYLNEKRRAKKGTPIDYAGRDILAQNRHIKFPNPLTTLRLLVELPTGLVLLCNGIVFAGLFTVTSSIPSQFKMIYGLNDLQVGFVFIPIGLATMFSAVINGYLIDWNYERIASSRDMLVTKGRASNFPIEEARLQIALPMLYFGAAVIVTYGWVLQAQTHIAIPLVLLLCIGYSITACFNIMNVLIVDLNYDYPATATAANNLVRCSLGAGSTAMVTPMIDAIGRGWAFTVVATMWLIMSPLLLVISRQGPKWREDKDAKRTRT